MDSDEYVVRKQLEHLAENKAWISSNFKIIGKKDDFCKGWNDQFEDPLRVGLVAATIVPYYGKLETRYFVLGGCEKRVNGYSCDGSGDCIYSGNNKDLMAKHFPNLIFEGIKPLDSEYFYYLENRSLAHPEAREPFWKGLV